MGKKNRPRPGHVAPTSPAFAATPSAPPPPPSIEAPPTLEEEAQVDVLLVAAKEAMEAVAVEPPDLPVMPSGRKLADLSRDALLARQQFEATKKTYEERRQQLDDELKDAKRRRKELDDAETRALERAFALDARERDLAARHEALLLRERDADAGFLVRRREVLDGIEAERARLAAEIATLRDRSEQARAEAAAAFQQTLEAQRARWESDEQDRIAAAEERRRARDDAAARARDEALARARREAGEVIARAEAEAEATRREADAVAQQLRDERAALRRDRTALAADRAVYREDAENLGELVARRAARVAEELTASLRATTEERDEARKVRDALWARVRAWEEVERRLGGRPVEELLAELEATKRTCNDLRRELQARPGAAERDRLVELEKQQRQWEEEGRVLRRELVEAREKLARRELAAIDMETLRDQREALGARNRMLKTALDDLQAQVDDLTRKDSQRNPMEALARIDAECAAAVPTAAPCDDALKTLADFADDLRVRMERAVESRTLYYSPRDVRCFLGGLAMSRLLLLQGISGTGKTSLPLAAAQALGGESPVVEVQAGWRDRQELLGYYNAFHRHYYASEFLQALYRAGTPRWQDRVCLIVLDEINLARVEQFFADFLSALEQPPDRRRVTLMDQPVADAPRLLREGRHLAIPPNVWFVGTANHDETTTGFADKTYDRAHVMELPRRDAAANRPAPPRRARDPISHAKLDALFRDAQAQRRKDAEQALDWLRKSSFAEELDARFRVGWGNRLARDVESYVPVVCAAGGTVGEALDHLVQTKVLRKLRDRYDVRASDLGDVKNLLRDEWITRGTPPDRSIALLDGEIRAKRSEESAG